MSKTNLGTENSIRAVWDQSSRNLEVGCLGIHHLNLLRKRGYYLLQNDCPGKGLFSNKGGVAIGDYLTPAERGGGGRPSGGRWDAVV